MDHLDVLLLLYRQKPASLTMDEIVSRTERPRDLVEKAVADLNGGGLLSEEDIGAGLSKFGFSPKSPDLAAAVEKLAAMHNERPVTLIRAIYDRPPEAVTSFADAFRFRGGGK
jgi:hypothetical protein